MAKCTAPVNGHRSPSAAAACPACNNRYGASYRSYSYSPSPYFSGGSYGNNRGKGSATVKESPRWSRAGSTVIYTPAEVRTLSPFRESIEKRELHSDLRDVFLCHAWDDRKGVAKILNDQLESLGISVWFSEKDVLLGSLLLREIDRGLAKSRVGIVLVTPSFLQRLKGEGIADKELSALLARDLLIPIIHNTTYDSLREVSPLLGSRSGLNTSDDSIENIAAKLAELVRL